MGGRAMQIVVPMAIGAFTGGMGAPATGFAEGIVGGTAKNLFGNMISSTFTETMASAVTGALIGGVGAGAMQMMTPDLPAQPDYSQQFGEQQAMLTQQQSFGRRSTGELEPVSYTHLTLPTKA